jgi:multiple sugar transport system permease protein
LTAAIRVSATPSTKRRTPVARMVGYALLYGVLILFSAFMLIPMAFAVLGSLKPEAEIFTVPIQWLPSSPQWQNYVLPFQKNIGRYFVNSMIVSLVQTFSPMILCSMAGYSLATFNYPGRNLVFLFILSTIMLPIQVTLVPTFLIIKELGWVNTYAGLIVPGLATTFGTFLMRQFFLSLPRELEEAARLDGCSPYGVFWRIVLPLAKPALATLSVFTLLSSWNDLIWPLIAISNHNNYTLQLGLAEFLGTRRTQWSLLMAGNVVATMPLIGFFLVAQKQFVATMTFSGLKG